MSQLYNLLCVDCKCRLEDLAQTSQFSEPRPLMKAEPIIWFLNEHHGHHLQYLTDLVDEEETFGEYFTEVIPPKSDA